MRGAAALRMLLFLAVGAGLTALVCLAYAFDISRGSELASVDLRFDVRGKKDPPKDLVVVEIDDDTFNDLQKQWPFPRADHGKVIDRLAKDGAKVIAYDVQFTEASALGEEDDFALAEAAGRAGNVVFSTTEVDAKGHTNILGGDENLKEFHARPANGLLPNDPGGVLRRIAYTVDGLKSFGVVATEVAEKKGIKKSDLGGDTSYIDYYGPPNTIQHVSFSTVYLGKTPKGFFKDKVVVVGPSAPSLQDIHPTSTSGDDQMAGAEIQANAIDTARRGFPLEDSPAGLDVALIVLLGMVAPVASLRFRPLVALGLAFGLVALYVVIAQLAFNGGTILSVVYPVAAGVVAAIGALVVHYVTAAFERERVRDLFSRFVPESVVDEVLVQAGDSLRLAGVQREGTVMFTDLRGFTSFAESLPVDEVLEVLNQYLEGMSDAILNHGGTLVAYMGDGIMAVFGAPIEQPDHATRALDTAREMLSTRLPAFNEYVAKRGLGEGFRMGIGLNTGPVMSGHVGSERRLEYTALGDTTNTAARLEGMTKGTPHQLFMAETTVDALPERPDDVEFVDEFEVRGRQAKIRIWTVDETTLGEPAESTGATAAG